jgi:hypothetical protein
MVNINLPYGIITNNGKNSVLIPVIEAWGKIEENMVRYHLTL